ncbi:MAG: ATP-binding protein [Planctomycetota bacterium]
MDDPGYSWFSSLTRTLNSGATRSVLLHGSTHDLYFDGHDYVPLVPFLTSRCGIDGVTQLVCELNGPIRLSPPGKLDELRNAWVAWRSGGDPGEMALRALVDRKVDRAKATHEAEFDRLVHEAAGAPTAAMEFLRQLCLMRRAKRGNGRPIYGDSLLIWIEAADLLVPDAGEDVGRLSPADRHRVTILRDWFGDAGFQDGDDSVVLLSESRGGVSRLVTSLPQVVPVEVPAPDEDRRHHFLTHHAAAEAAGSASDLAASTAGLSTQALRQLLRQAQHEGKQPDADDVVAAVERHVASELGEDVVEFQRPTHTLADVVGNTRLKAFLADEFIPRIRSTGLDALSGAAVAGPIGAGKTFIFEAVAGELGLPVLTLKNLRSQWYGQTDVVFERLRRVLASLGKVVIVVDEADTAFGGVGAGQHETERRLTGKVQQMMSDPALRGRVTWLLMTARIHLLSPDIRRPGRAGDLILPVLDPTGDDRVAFVRWMLDGYVAGDLDEMVQHIEPELDATSAAAFGSLRSQLKARSRRDGPLDVDAIRSLVADYLPPAIGPTRRFQTLQALVNTTRKSLLPDPESVEREAWMREIRALEASGVS